MMLRIGLLLTLFAGVELGAVDEKAKVRPEKEPNRKMAAVVAVFSEHDRHIISRYFETHEATLPPGLAKRGGALPPGLEKQLRRNGRLPPGLQKRAQPFPPDLARELAPLPEGYRRVIVEGRAVIVDRRNRILDIMVIWSK